MHMYVSGSDDQQRVYFCKNHEIRTEMLVYRKRVYRFAFMKD